MNEINIKKEFFCRCCLLKDVRFSDMTSNTFQHDGNDISYFDAYEKLFQFLASSIPQSWENKKMCETCANNLKDFYTFHKSCFQFQGSRPDVCRCCQASEQPLTKVIKCERNEETDLHKSFLYQCVGASESDNFEVCYHCQKRMELARKFYLLCYRSSQQLTELFKRSNLSTETVFVKKESGTSYEHYPPATISFEISTKEEPELNLQDDSEQQTENTKEETKPKMKGRPKKIQSIVHIQKQKLKELATTTTISKMFHCDYCYEIFDFRSQILRHMKTHLGSTNSRGNKRNSAINQEPKHKITEPVKAKRSRAKTKIPKHQISETPNASKQYKCGVCTEIFKYRNHLSIHMEKHKNVLNKCPDCSELFTNPLEFKKHLSYHTLMQPPTYYSENSKHAQQIKGVGSHLCKQCPQVFKQNLDLELHQFHAHDIVYSGEQSTFPFLDEVELRAELQNIVLIDGKASHKYICLKCNTKFNMRGPIVLHVKTVHLKIRKYKCTYCSADYKTRSMLNYHLKKHAEDNDPLQDHSIFATKPFGCPLCLKKFSTQPQLTKHIRVQHGPTKMYECKLCSKTYKQLRSLWEHTFQHRGFFAYNCTECSYQVNQKQIFVRHLKNEHNQEFMTSKHEYTKESYTDVVNFNWNISESDDNPIPDQDQTSLKMPTPQMVPIFSCSLCTGTFSSYAHLKLHNSIAHDFTEEETTFKCTKCEAVFKRSIDLKSHQLTHDQHYQCAFCAAIYYKRRFIEAHLKKHVRQKLKNYVEPIPTVKNRSKPRLFQCDQCPKVFKFKCSLDHHLMQKHDAPANVAQLQCLVCQKWYPASKLKRHLDAVHTNIRKYKCEQCPSAFKSKGNLMRHLHIHKTDDNCYKCPECPKTFLSTTGLGKHVKMCHLNDVFACSDCDSVFQVYERLYEHTFFHKGFDPFSCPEASCTYTSRAKQDFANHLFRRHNIIFDNNSHGYHPRSETDSIQRYEEKLRLASDELPYQCYDCSKSFLSKYAVKRHILAKYCGK